MNNVYGLNGLRSPATVYNNNVYTNNMYGKVPALPFKLAKSSLLGVTGEDGTFVRATPATVNDHEGVIRGVLSNEARFQYQRRVENNFAGADYSTEDLTTLVSATALNSLITKDTIELTDTDASYHYFNDFNLKDIGTEMVASVDVQWISGATYVGVRFTEAAGGNDEEKAIDISDGLVHRVTLSLTKTKTSQCQLGMDNRGAVVLNVQQGPTKVRFTNLMIQDKTGASDPTVPDSYVSTGVGVGKNLTINGGFDINLDGYDDISSGAGSISQINGEASLTTTSNDALNRGWIEQAYSTIIGKEYIWEVDVVLVDGAGSLNTRAGTTSGTNTVLSDLGYGTGGKSKRTFIATTTTTYLSAYANNINTSTIDNWSLKTLDHGSNVDGVKCFMTANGNTVTDNVVTEAEGISLEDTREVLDFTGSEYGTLEEAITFTADFEIEVKFATSSAAAVSLLGDTVVNSSLIYIPVSGKITCRFGDGVDKASTTTVTDGKIHTALMKRVGTTCSISIDGVEEYSATLALNDVEFTTLGTNQYHVRWDGQILSTKFTDLRTNVSRWNRDFTQAALWLKTNAPSATKDQIGIDGKANSCSLLTDDSINAESFYQDYNISDDNAVHVAHVYIRKDTDTSRFPEMHLDCVVGTNQKINTQLNTQTGAIVDRASIGTTTSNSELVSLGGFDWWKVTLTVQNNTSGNNVLRFRIYASATDVFGAWNSAATGTIIVDAVQVELNHSDIKSNIFTEATQVSVADEVTDYALDSVSDKYQLPIDVPLEPSLVTGNNSTLVDSLGDWYAGAVGLVTYENQSIKVEHQGFASGRVVLPVTLETSTKYSFKAELIEGFSVPQAFLAVTLNADGSSAFEFEQFDVENDIKEFVFTSAGGSTSQYIVLQISGDSLGDYAYFKNITLQKLPDETCVLTNVALTDWYDYSQSKIDAGIIAGFKTNKAIPIGYFSEIVSANYSRWNRDFTQSSLWLNTNAPSATKDQIGIDGRANSCSLITDDSGALSESFYQDYTIPNNNATHVMHMYVRQDKDVSRFPEIQLDCVAGTSQRIGVQLNTQTGALIDRINTGTTTFASELVSHGGLSWWKVILTVQNNTSGNTTYAIQVELSKAFPTSTIFTEGSAVTRNKDELTYPTGNIPVNDCAGKFEWTPTATGQGANALIGNYLNANNDMAVYMASSTSLRLRKRVAGTTVEASTSLTPVAGTTYIIKYRFDSVLGMDIWVSDVKGSNNANTTDLALGTTLNIGYFHSASGLWQTGGIDNLTIYEGRLTDAEVVAL